MALMKHKAWALENPIFFTPPPVRGRYVHGLWGGGGGDAPKAPDPIETANAQSKANIDSARVQAALNRTNSSTAFGTSTWSQDPNNQDSWTNTVKLSQPAQNVFDQYSNLSSQALPSVDFSKLPAVPSADLSGIKMPDIAGIQQQTAGMFSDNSGDIARSRGLAQGQAGIMQQLQQQAKDTYAKGLSYDSLGAMPTADNAMRQQVQDALYANSTRSLDPQWQQQESDLSSSLAAQGINLGTEAYDRAMGNFSRSKNDAYSQARNDATTMSTDQMQKLFQMAMAARQEGVSEINNKYNSPMDLLTKGAGVYSTLENSVNQDLGTQINQRQAQQSIASQRIADETSKAALQASFINSQHQNTAADRTNAVNEQLAQHSTALNDRTTLLNQLMSMANGAQTQQGSPVQVAAAPVAQSIYNTYQGQLSAYNAAQQSKNGMLGTLGSLGGAAMMMMAA